MPVIEWELGYNGAFLNTSDVRVEENYDPDTTLYNVTSIFNYVPRVREPFPWVFTLFCGLILKSDISLSYFVAKPRWRAFAMCSHSPGL